MQSRRVSLAKAVSWRVVASVSTFALVLLFTGKLELAATVGAVEVVLKIALYYGHERGWAVAMGLRRRATMPHLPHSVPSGAAVARAELVPPREKGPA